MDEVHDLFEKLKPVYGEKLNDLQQVYLIEDYQGKKEIETTLQIMASKVFNQYRLNSDPILIPPSEQDAKGNVVLGDVVYAGKKLYPFGLRFH